MALFGPPPVSAKIWSKAVNPDLSAKMKTIETVGSKYGNSIFQNVCLAVAPSIAAASRISSGIL